jgi:hypothetical protein
MNKTTFFSIMIQPLFAACLFLFAEKLSKRIGNRMKDSPLKRALFRPRGVSDPARLLRRRQL